MRAALVALALLVPAQALAAGPPSFFVGQRYVANPALCTGDPTGENVEDTLEINEGGIFGYEFGCVFLDFLPGEAVGVDPNVQTVLATCGDDSGITRPDNFSLIFDATDPATASVVVQSQNEFVTGQTFVSRTYSICTAE